MIYKIIPLFLKNMARPDGLSTFISHNLRSFESNIEINDVCDKYKILNTIKSYYKEYKKILFTPYISDELFFCNKECTFKSSIKIHGIIEKEDINDNDVFEQVYKFFERIFLDIQLSSLTFVFKGIDEQKIYKIKKCKVCKSL